MNSMMTWLYCWEAISNQRRPASSWEGKIVKKRLYSYCSIGTHPWPMVIFAEDENRIFADSALCCMIIGIVIKVCEEFTEHAFNTSVLKSLPRFGHERQRPKRLTKTKRGLDDWRHGTALIVQGQRKIHLVACGLQVCDDELLKPCWKIKLTRTADRGRLTRVVLQLVGNSWMVSVQHVHMRPLLKSSGRSSKLLLVSWIMQITHRIKRLLSFLGHETQLA